MATSSTYLDELINKSNAAAAAKKEALDRKLKMQTTAQVDEKGNITYQKDDSGNNLYGSIDVDYMQRNRAAAAGAESTGMLKSGQYARTLAENQAAYRSNIIGAKEQTEAEKTSIGENLATEQAQYKAQYGNVGGGVGGSSGGGSKSKNKTQTSTPSSGMTPITPPPQLPMPTTPTISRPTPVTRRPGQPVIPRTGRY